MDLEVIKKCIEEFNKLPRQHANHFNWHVKEIKEIGIAHDFFFQLENVAEDKLVKIDNAEDPPDVRVVTSTGKIMGIEITELVNEKAIELQIKKDEGYVYELLKWDKEYTLSRIQEIINEKNKLCEQIPPDYHLRVLLIHTDEPKLRSRVIKEYIGDHQWPESPSFDEIYLLVGYDPETGRTELIKLKG